MLTAAQRPLAMLIRYAVHFVDPEAEVILYGSQARGEANKWSDWDVVVLRNCPITDDYWGSILDNVYNVELATGEVITVAVEEKARWEKQSRMLFHQNVTRDGIELHRIAV